MLTRADRVVAVGEIRAKDLEAIGGRPVDVITNGYDETDFSEKNTASRDKFTIVHVGAMNRDRNHPAFWKVLGELLIENDTFSNKLEVQLVGKVDYSVNALIEKHRLEKYVVKIEYLPHDQISGVLKSASLLYLPINNTPKPNSIIPGKIFEYLASGRPVLGTGPVHGDSAAILRKTKSGIMVDFEDEESLKKALLDFLSQYERNEQLEYQAPEEYSRRHLAARMAAIFSQLEEEK